MQPTSSQATPRPTQSAQATGSTSPETQPTSDTEAHSTGNRGTSKMPAPISGAFGLAKELWQRFSDDYGFTRSAALAFFGVLSLVPVLLFALAALGFFIQDPAQIADYIRRFIANYMPGRQAARAANEVITQTGVLQAAQELIHGRWTALVVGVVSLLWTATQLLASAAEPMNAAWDVRETRPFWKLRLQCLVLFFGAGLFFVLALAVTSFPEFAAHLTPPNYGLPGFLVALLNIVSWVAAIAVNVALFTMLYRFLPDANVPWRAALAGGVVTGVFWEIFKQIFAWYATNFGNFNKTYGALGGLVLLITWIYYSCVLLVIGAEVSRMWSEYRENGSVTHRDKHA